jgi:DnaJ-class molecular chaperone
MPRRREADAEDMLARCPHCRGATAVADLASGTKVTCPVCAGVGRVNQRVFLAYRAGTLDIAGTTPAGTPANSTDAPHP